MYSTVKDTYIYIYIYILKANPSAKLYLNGSLMKTNMPYTYLSHIIHYKNVFRRFLGYYIYCIASSMFAENRTDGFDARINKLVYGFRERLQISENSLIETVINSSAWRSSRLLNLWERYLYLP